MKPMKMKFKANTYSVGTIWMNTDDAKKMGIKNGDLVVVENPLGKSTKGKVFASGGMRPGIIKSALQQAEGSARGMGAAYKSRDYTPSHSDLVDPDVLSPIMGFPDYADMIVKVKRLKN